MQFLQKLIEALWGHIHHLNGGAELDLVAVDQGMILVGNQPFVVYHGAIGGVGINYFV